MSDQENVLDPGEVEEWDDFMEELLEAIEVGMLDKHIKIIAKSCYKRRDVLIEQRNARRKPKPGGAPQPAGPSDENPYKNMELTALGYEFYNAINYAGEWFSKHDLQTIYGRGQHRLLFTGSKLDDCTVEIVKVNRTNAVLRVVKAEGWRARSGRGRVENGDKINMPLHLLVKEAILQTKNFHAWNDANQKGSEA